MLVSARTAIREEGAVSTKAQWWQCPWCVPEIGASVAGTEEVLGKQGEDEVTDGGRDQIM